jgi:hypothetical protein
MRVGYLSAPAPVPERYIPARLVADRLGIRTRTLAKWRWQGRGPAGWFPASKTFVLYPASEVDRYIDELRRAKP